MPYCYTPSAGDASAIAVLDGSLVPESGSVSMNADHVLWAFGNPSSGTRFTGMMTVPTDFTQIPYPEFYQRAPSFTYTVPDPYCAIATGVVAYPTSYLGAFPLPAVQGSPLPAAVSRGAGVKDYWQYGLTNPSTNAGCSGDMHVAFVKTLQRLRKLGADHARHEVTVRNREAPLAVFVVPSAGHLAERLVRGGARVDAGKES